MRFVKKYKNDAARGVQNMLTGRGISSKFFTRNFFATGFFLFVCVSFIGQRFDCVTSMEKIKKLDRQIATMRTYKQEEVSRYMTLTRESAMQHAIDSLGLGLNVPEQYPLAIPYRN